MQRSLAVELWVALAARYNAILRDPSEDAGRRALGYLLDVRKLAKLTNTGRPYAMCMRIYGAVRSGLSSKSILWQIWTETPVEYILGLNSSSFKSRFVLEKLKAENEGWSVVCIIACRRKSARLSC